MSTTTSAPKIKIYHLIDNGNSSVEHYQRVSKNQRVRVGNRKNDRPALQITFTDESGTNRTIRFKLNCNTPYQDEQIEKHKIPANERFTDAERAALWIRGGVLVAKNPIAQQFLDIHPQNGNFKGSCPDIPGPLFVEYKPEEKTLKNVTAFKRRLQAANKIAELSLEEAQGMLVRLNGTFYKAPDKLNDCIDVLVDYLDECDEDGIEDILRDGVSLEDEITILINKATGNGVLSFNEVGMENFVVKKQAGRTIPLKEISKNLPEQERRRLFSEFLASNDGTLHLEDLRKIVNAKDENVKDDNEDGQKEKPLNKMNLEELAVEYKKVFNAEIPETLKTKKDIVAAIEAELVES